MQHIIFDTLYSYHTMERLTSAYASPRYGEAYGS